MKTNMIRHRIIRVSFLAISLASLSASAAWAQSTLEPIEDTSGIGKWALAYGLVGLCIVLGLINICRPGRRKGDAPRPT
jgi:hypothetical protein